MKRLDSSASNAGVERGEKYNGCIIFQRDGESTYSFLRRIMVEVVLQVNSSMTIYEVGRELEDLTGITINMPYLLSTLIFKDSGIVISGNIVSASVATERLANNILNAGNKILIQAGGKMEEEKLFSLIRTKTAKPLSDLTIRNSLKSIKQKTRRKKNFYYLQPKKKKK